MKAVKLDIIKYSTVLQHLLYCFYTTQQAKHKILEKADKSEFFWGSERQGVKGGNIKGIEFLSLRNISGDIVCWVYVSRKLIQKGTKIIYIACSHKK